MIRDVPDFPKPGIIFKDITPVLQNGEALKQVIDTFAEHVRPLRPTHIVGIESRGFIFGTALAYTLGCGFVPVRKPKKLPCPTYQASYDLEYGQDSVHIHQDALKKGDRALVIDDLLATGGTARATCSLVEQCGAQVLEVCVVIELGFLGGREKLSGRSVYSLVTY
jgi:adenine phosphoribosyltransferase